MQITHVRNATMLAEIGFANAIVMDSAVTLGKVTVTRTDGQHGSKEFMTEHHGPRSPGPNMSA